MGLDGVVATGGSWLTGVSVGGWIGGGIESDVGSVGCAAGDVSTGSMKAGLSLSMETVSGLPRISSV